MNTTNIEQFIKTTINQHLNEVDLLKQFQSVGNSFSPTFRMSVLVSVLEKAQQNQEDLIEAMNLFELLTPIESNNLKKETPHEQTNRSTILIPNKEIIQ